MTIYKIYKIKWLQIKYVYYSPKLHYTVHKSVSVKVSKEPGELCDGWWLDNVCNLFNLFFIIYVVVYHILKSRGTTNQDRTLARLREDIG